MNVQFAGEIGPFLDIVQQRQVSVVVAGTCKCAPAGASGSAAQLEQQVQAQILRAIHETIAPKMASGQLSFKDLGTNNTATIVPEIFARSGLAQAGIAVDRLLMRFGIDGRDPPPLPSSAPKAPMQAAAPQQVNVRVGGFNVHASSGGGIDTAGLKSQLVDKVKATLMWWAFGICAVVLVLAALGGYGYYVYRNTPSAAPPAAAAKAEGKEARPPAKK
jgi:hypothetical protein